ncbi:Mss4-like protein [Exophiala viscosa]|uniref:Mss4-like protein n=1 Tax=Exophiala viscosa TaxID=2486360 RepID=A0AAN6IDB2_9EURO|nr:Mss4-like protein [Exophiala viscosa]KAI1626372.1 Mss4-like protein [Exophiala viscosa]
MFESSCLCGANRISFEADSILKMRCHCIDCRKFSGSTNTNNLLVPVAGLKVLKGQLKTYTKTVESGNDMTSYFCDQCGSTLYRQSSMSDKAVAVMIGGIDGLEAIENGRPEHELFVRNRPSWMKAIEGSSQEEGHGLPKVKVPEAV